MSRANTDVHVEIMARERIDCHFPTSKLCICVSCFQRSSANLHVCIVEAVHSEAL